MLDNKVTNHSNFRLENLHIAKYEGVVTNVICSQAFLFGESNMGENKRILGVCFYCGKNAFYRFKNGKLCCSNNVSKCPTVRKINSEKNKFKFCKIEHAKRKAEGGPICACDCGNRTKWNKDKGEYNKYINGHWVRHNNPSRGKDKYAKKKRRRSPLCKCIPQCGQRTKWNPCTGKYDDYIKYHHLKGAKRDKKFCENQSKRMIKNNPMQKPEIAKKQSESLKALGDDHPSRRLEHRKRTSEYALNGHATYMCSCNSNPSKPQAVLFELIKSLYSTAILNHPSLNFSIDIAIPDLNIAIEYDEPYWHDFEKDKIRQRKLETIGWRFLRYISYVPTINELKNNILNIINKEG